MPRRRAERAPVAAPAAETAAPAAETAAPAAETPDLLRAEGVGVQFGGLVALDGVSIRVPRGSIVGLIGPNGAGKTTLFNVVGGFVTPRRGRVLFEGRDITHWPPHRRAEAGIGRTFQKLEVFRHMSVIDNLTVAHEVGFSSATMIDDVLGLPRSRREEARARARADQVLDLVGLRWARDREADELPLGVGRIIELGRALCCEPKLLLLDEPSSGLDLRETAELGGLIRRVRDEARVTVLVVEHDMSLVMSICEYIFVLDFARLIAEGPPEAVRADPAVRAAYLGAEEATG